MTDDNRMFIGTDNISMLCTQLTAVNYRLKSEYILFYFHISLSQVLIFSSTWSKNINLNVLVEFLMILL